MTTVADVAEAYRAVCKDWEISPREAARGLCGDTATVAWERLGKPDDVEFRATPGDARYASHTWLYCGGRHIDAEVPEGVEHAGRLPIFQALRREVKSRRV